MIFPVLSSHRPPPPSGCPWPGWTGVSRETPGCSRRQWSHAVGGNLLSESAFISCPSLVPENITHSLKLLSKRVGFFSVWMRFFKVTLWKWSIHIAPEIGGCGEPDCHGHLLNIQPMTNMWDGCKAQGRSDTAVAHWVEKKQAAHPHQDSCCPWFSCYYNTLIQSSVLTRLSLPLPLLQTVSCRPCFPP